MIRVVIERLISQGKLEQYHDLIRQAKNKASNVPGFLSGEIFHQKDNPNHVFVMSCWDSEEAWDVWAESEQRLDLLDTMRPLLDEEEKVVILEHSIKSH